MTEKRPVVLYGASGFSGRRSRNSCASTRFRSSPPDAVAPRSRRCLDRRCGIGTADYEVVEVGHSVDELVELFAGARVVCNTVGPCFRYGATVVEAALQAGCHYLDTGGETPWVRTAKHKTGASVRRTRPSVAPATAYMSATAEIAARIAIENAPGIDTLEILSMLKGNPSNGSTQTVYGQLVYESIYLEDNEYRTWPPLTVLDVTIPRLDYDPFRPAVGGFPAPGLVQGPSADRDVRSFGGILDPVIMQGVIAGERDYVEKLSQLPLAEQQRILSELATAARARHHLERTAARTEPWTSSSVAATWRARTSSSTAPAPTCKPA